MKTSDPYADYGKQGRELRHIADQLEEQEAADRAMEDLSRVTLVVSALAEELRRNRRRRTQ
jgi:hypothetical protein